MSTAVHVQALATSPVADPAPAIPEQHDGQFGLRRTRPRPTTTVISVLGAVDLRTVPRLREFAREPGASGTLIIDLSRVSFLGLTGIETLVQIRGEAGIAGRGLRLVTGPRCVERALVVTGLRASFDCSPSLRAALRR